MLRTLLVASLLASSACVPPRLFAPGVVYDDLGGVRSVRASFMNSFVYVVPVADGGVVLVDSGVPADRDAILRAAAGRPVRAILLTHGHVDHAAGVTAWPGVPVYVGRGDLPRLLGARTERNVLPEAGWILFARPKDDGRFVPVDDGQSPVLGGTRFYAFAVPGHTPGSTAWLWRNVLFTGDAVLAERSGDLDLSYWIYSDDLARAWRSLGRLRGVPFDVTMDGHYGRTDRARSRLVRRLRRPRSSDFLHGIDVRAFDERW